MVKIFMTLLLQSLTTIRWRSYSFYLYYTSYTVENPRFRYSEVPGRKHGRDSLDLFLRGNMQNPVFSIQENKISPSVTNIDMAIEERSLSPQIVSKHTQATLDTSPRVVYK